MPQNEMIDRITDVLMSDGCGDSIQCEKTARRVIAAMREPTADMVEEAWAYALAEDAAGVWRDMINTALGGDEGDK